MAIRGENIGTAYIRILADGDGFDRSVREQFEDVDWDSLGRKGSKEWQEGFAKEQESEPNRNAFRDSVVGPLVRGKWLSEEFFKGKNWTTFENDLDKHYKSAGVLARENLEKELLEGLPLQQLEGRLKNFGRDLIRAQEQIDKAHSAAIMEDKNRLFAQSAERDQEFEDHITALHQQAMKERLDLDRDFMANHDRLAAAAAAEQERLLGESLDRDRDFFANHKKLVDEAVQAEHDRLAQWQTDIDNAEASYRVHINNMRRQQESGDSSMLGSGRAASELTKQLKFLRGEYKQLAAGSRNAAFDQDELRDRMHLLHGANFDLIRDNESLREQWRDLNRDVNTLHPTLARLERAFAGISDKVGRAFGKGSRNNFLNFVGSVVGGMTNIVPAIGRGITKFGDLFTFLDEDGNKILDTFGGFSKILGGAITGMGAFAAFSLGVIGPLVSILSLAAGAVTALASTIGMGLVGAAAAATGAFTGLLGLVGGGIIAFANLTGEAKKSAGEVAKAFKGLGAEITTGMLFDRRQWKDELPGIDTVRTFSQQMEELKGHAADFAPMLRHLGQAIGDTTDKLLDFLSTKGWDDFITKLTGTQGKMGFLANSANKMGDFIVHMFAGLTGGFQALIPVSNRFLGWLRDSGRAFDDWVNKGRGIPIMTRFFNDAGDSAADLAGFLGAVGDLLGTLITQGNEAGDSLFKSMTNAVQGWADFLNTAQGKSALRDWFNDSKDFARALGEVVVNVGKLGDVLDNTFSRNIATGAIQVLSHAISGITNVLGFFADALGTGKGQMEAFAGQVVGGLLLWRGFASKVGLGTTAVRTLGTTAVATEAEVAAAGTASVVAGEEMAAMGAAGTVGRFSRIAGAARGMAGIAGIGAITLASQTSNKSLSVLGDTAGGALLGFQVGGPWGAAIGAGAGLLLGLASSSDESADSMEDAAPKADEFAQSLKNLGTAAGQATRDLAAQKLQEDGTLEAASRLGINTRDVVDATLGHAGAIKRVNDALKQSKVDLFNQAKAGKLTNEQAVQTDKDFQNVRGTIAQYSRDIRHNTDSVNNARNASKTWAQALKGLPPKIVTDVRALGSKPAIDDIAQLRAQYDLTPHEVATVMRAVDYDVTDRQVRSLFHDFKKIPDKVETKLDALNWDATAGQVAGLVEQYNLTPKKVSTLIRATGLAKTDDDVKALTDRILKLAGKKANPQVGIKKGVFDDGIADIEGDVKDVNGLKPTPKADLDLVKFKSGKSIMDGLMRDLGNQKPTPKADLALDAFRAGMGNVMGAISLANHTTATPHVNVNVDRQGLDSLIGDLGNLNTSKTITVTTNYVSTYSGKVPKGGASGFMTTGPQVRLIGEAGPEAVVPLNRQLSQVDPAVRMLSAIAQGKAEGMAKGGVVGSGKTYNVNQYITTPNSDARAVAAETVNKLVAVGY